MTAICSNFISQRAVKAWIIAICIDFIISVLKLVLAYNTAWFESHLLLVRFFSFTLYHFDQVFFCDKMSSLAVKLDSISERSILFGYVWRTKQNKIYYLWKMIIVWSLKKGALRLSSVKELQTDSAMALFALNVQIQGVRQNSFPFFLLLMISHLSKHSW